MSKEKPNEDPRQQTDWKNTKQTDQPWKGPVEREQRNEDRIDLEKWHNTNTTLTGRWIARRTTIGCVRFSSAPCFHKRCYSRVADTAQIGSGNLPASKARGPIYYPIAIAKTLAALARICTARAT